MILTKFNYLTKTKVKILDFLAKNHRDQKRKINFYLLFQKN